MASCARTRFTACAIGTFSHSTGLNAETIRALARGVRKAGDRIRRQGTQLAREESIDLRGRHIRLLGPFGRAQAAGRHEIAKRFSLGVHVAHARRGDFIHQHSRASACPGYSRRLLAAGGEVAPAFAAGFRHKTNALDHGAAIDRFHHVVDSKRRDAGGGERFHFHAGLSGRFDHGENAYGASLSQRFEIDARLRDRDGMAERDEFGCLFGSHDARDACRREHIALGSAPRNNSFVSLCRQDDEGFGGGFALGRSLGRNIDHARRAFFIEMRELAHEAMLAPINAFVAAATSACRIRLSPMRKVVTPISASRLRSAGSDNPLSATIRMSFGMRGARRSVTPRSVTNVRRSRLLMPIMSVFSASARSSSASSWTSTRTSIFQCRAKSRSAFASWSVTDTMMMRMQSAPQARASAT